MRRCIDSFADMNKKYTPFNIINRQRSACEYCSTATLPINQLSQLIAHKVGVLNEKRCKKNR